jgi:uncharacterized protein (DUF305 family)
VIGGTFIKTSEPAPAVTHQMESSDSMAAMMNRLEDQQGVSFDQAFIEEMIMHHQGAIDMAELALTRAEHQEIKDLANEIITAQKSEINMMRGWTEAWF